MNDTTKQLLVTLFKSWKSSTATWHPVGLENYCSYVQQLIQAEGQLDERAWRHLLFGSHDGPALGLALSAWPKNKRGSLNDYAKIAQKYFRVEVTEEIYIAFRKEFFEKCNGCKPKVVFNRLIGLMFPGKFVQVPNEDDMSMIYSGLEHMGVFQQCEEVGGGTIRDQEADNNAEAQWFRENTAVMAALQEALQSTDARVTEYELGSFAWELGQWFNVDPSATCKAVVKYGPPGTGKTYGANLEAKKMLEAWNLLIAGGQCTLDGKVHIRTMQFHPSIGYEDFMEGLRPFRVKRKDLDGFDFPLRLVNGSFKNFCRDAGKWEIDLANYLSDKKPDGIKCVSDLLSMSLEEFREKHLGLLQQIRNPAQNSHWKTIEKLQPMRGGISLGEALPPYIFIIDEINRADLSRVFGELMLCIENRGPDYAVATQYASLNDTETGMVNLGEKGEGNDDWRFFVPSNVHIIGTMNVIDRSVESFDFALRRRFHWERDDSDSSVVEVFVKKFPEKIQQTIAEQLIDGLDALNAAIKNDFGADWQIGHAYFKDIARMPITKKKASAIAKEIADMVWRKSIRPLLEEYLRGNDAKDNENKLNALYDKFLLKQKKGEDQASNG